ncbi:precorrin-2 dehydrogenase/sirohydrochlorin ferrochelatase family protein [Stetteria hydrogenophila]
MGWIPLYVNPEGFRVLVVGGGRVGEGRALLFSRAGARVKVAAMDFTEGLRAEAGRGSLELVRLRLPEDWGRLVELIEESDLVVVAVSDPGIARRVAEEALSRGKLVNNAVDYRLGNVVVPFRGSTSYGLHYAVTSLGRTGIAARAAAEKIRECLERDEELRALYYSMARLKEWLKANVPSPRKRMPIYFKVAGDEAYRRAVARGDAEEALRRALEVARAELAEDP